MLLRSNFITECCSFSDNLTPLASGVTLILLAVVHELSTSNFCLKIKKDCGINSNERHVYESVDDSSLSHVISQKSTERKYRALKGGTKVFGGTKFKFSLHVSVAIANDCIYSLSIYLLVAFQHFIYSLFIK